MEDEFLFEMLEEAVAFAADDLVLKGNFKPFAYALTVDNKSIPFNSDKGDDTDAYDTLWQKLKEQVKAAKFKAVVLLQESSAVESFNLPTQQCIRVHVESSDNLHEKIGARCLYIPYELYQKEGKQEIKLFQPKPIAFPHEILKI